MEELKERVTCPQCKTVFGDTNSRLLPCLHTFCLDCLKQLPVHKPASTQDNSSATTTPTPQPSYRYIECPLCQSQWPLPDKGVEGFQSSLIIADLTSTYRSVENYGQDSGPRCCHCIRTPSPLAVAYCYACRYFICQQCHQMHQKWIEYERHDVVSLGDVRSEQEPGTNGTNSE